MESPKASTLVTSVVASVGAIPAGLAVAWAKSKGIDLDAAQQAALVTTGGIAVGAASNWVVAIIESFVKAVVALNDALASRAGQIVDKLGGMPPKQGGFVRLSMLAVLLALSLIALPGCGLMPKGADIPVSQQLPPAAQAAQAVINQANYALAAGYGAIRDGVRDGTIEPKQGRAWYIKLDEVKAKVDAAQGLLMQGSFDAAKAQAQAMQAILKIIQQELIKAAAKKSAEMPVLLIAA